MSLQHLRTFIEVYRRHSLTEAAPHLSLTQPAVSQQIASLEQQVGRRLFIRSRRGVVPTAVADELAASLGGSLDHAEAVLATMQARSAQLSGVVHLAGPAEYVGEQFVGSLARLASSGIDVRVRLGGRDMIYSQLVSGDVDLAITASKPDHYRLEATPIAVERLLLIVPAASGIGQSIDALVKDLPFCAYDSELPLIREWCAANDMPVPTRRPSIVIPDLRILLRCVIAGAGWSVLPDYLSTSAIDAGAVRVPFDNLIHPMNGLYLVWTKGSLRHPRVVRTRDLLMASLR